MELISPSSPISELGVLDKSLSTLTKWELTKWQLTKWEVDQMGIDEVGIDKVGIDEVGRYPQEDNTVRFTYHL